MQGEIRCEYTGFANRVPVSIAGDASHMKVILVTYGDESTPGDEKVLFTGEEFSEKELARRLDTNKRN